MYVRGTAMTPALRVTLAHELTHVLQDQNFDLNRVGKLPSAQSDVLRALAEGDATRIEDDYAAKVLTDKERKEYENQQSADSDAANAKLKDDVPPILTAVFSSPYILGPELLNFLERKGGDKAIDKAFTDLPTEEELFDPQTYGTPAAKPQKVSIKAPSGAKTVDSGEFGPTTWFLLLASRAAPGKALTAVDGWGGDQYVVYRKAGTVCFEANVRSDTAADLKDFSTHARRVGQAVAAGHRVGGEDG